MILVSYLLANFVTSCKKTNAIYKQTNCISKSFPSVHKLLMSLNSGVYTEINSPPLSFVTTPLHFVIVQFWRLERDIVLP
jgi:hypothetical protein